MRLIKLLSILIIFSLPVWAEESTCIEALNTEAEICNEPIVPEYEIDNVLITFFWFDTEREMQEYYLSYSDETEIDDKMRAFSEDEPYFTKNICHLDLFVVRPKFVDDDMTLSIGHEVEHCVYGDYHKSGEE